MNKVIGSDLNAFLDPRSQGNRDIHHHCHQEMKEETDQFVSNCKTKYNQISKLQNLDPNTMQIAKQLLLLNPKDIWIAESHDIFYIISKEFNSPNKLFNGKLYLRIPFETGYDVAFHSDADNFANFTWMGEALCTLQDGIPINHLLYNQIERNIITAKEYIDASMARISGRSFPIPNLINKDGTFIGSNVKQRAASSQTSDSTTTAQSVTINNVNLNQSSNVELYNAEPCDIAINTQESMESVLLTQQPAIVQPNVNTIITVCISSQFHSFHVIYRVCIITTLCISSNTVSTI